MGEIITWTPARQDVLRQLYPSATPEALLAALNALPGRRVTSFVNAGRQANALGISRPQAAKPRGWALRAAQHAATRLTPERESLFRQLHAAGTPYARAIPALNALPGPPFTSKLQLLTWSRALGLGGSLAIARRGENCRTYTPERLALIRQHCIAGMAWPDILPLVNALPGQPVSSYQRLYEEAADRGFLRLRPTGQQPCAYSARPKAKAQPRTPKPRAPKPPAPPRFMPPRAEPPPRPAVLAPEEVDARTAVRLAAVRAALAKRAADPSALASQYRIPLREVFRLQGEMRDARRRSIGTHPATTTTEAQPHG